MTIPDIAHRRLLAQRLIGAKPGQPSAVVEWLAAAQAQDYAGAKWALGMRAPGTTDADVEHAFATGAILRTHLLRPTWHFVSPGDIRWLLDLTAPRVHAANAYMYRKLGLDEAIFKRSNAVLARALRGGQHLTRDELRDVLATAGVATEGEFRMGYLMMRAELEGVVCSGPRRGNQFTYALLDERVPPARPLEREEAVALLIRRYFSSRGPATIQDFAKWSGLTAADARRGVEAEKATLDSEIIDAKTYVFARTGRRAAPGHAPTAHLLSIYDEYVSGYKDRSAIGDAATGARLSAMGNALTSIVVVNGRIRGTWKRTLQREAVAIDLDVFGRLSSDEQHAVDAAAQRYRAFLGKDGSAHE